MEDRTALEEKVAHLLRTVEDLSDVIARQEGEIETLNRRVALLMQREAQRDCDSGEGVPLADQVPPHW
ncbi:SlyX family protein [Salibaculum halophilum]|uniref:SlyX family protein n=1 Tax=Salibaculum halophilum TaxID=1914408 RepID=UPI000A10CCF7|nr:SlyX family protein [Salibaculum halophilum]